MCGIILLYLRRKEVRKGATCLVLLSSVLFAQEGGLVDKYLIKEYLRTLEEETVYSKQLDELVVARKQKKVILQRNMDIRLHPEFITTLIFPEEIARAEASFRADKFTIQGRRLFIQPSVNFVKGNIVLTLKNGYTVNIYAEKDTKNIYLTYYIKRARVLDGVEVLDAFYSKYRFYPSEPTLVVIDGVSYFIEPSRFGNIQISDGSRRVYRVKVLISK